MSQHELKRQGCEANPRPLERRPKAVGEQYRQVGLRRWLPAALVAFAVILVALPAGAQTPAAPAASTQPQAEIPCSPTGLPLVKVPELTSKDGKLRATVILSDEEVRMTFRQPYRLPNDPATRSAPNNNAVTKCSPQQVRIFRGVRAMPEPPGPTNGYSDPLPGPTLRARVGDLIQLTFINQINPAHFGKSIDEGEKGACDQVAGVYPGSDTFPDCFHGSSTGNIHFHGTHTNPNTTGDNVLLEIRPSSRGKDNKPIVTPKSVKIPFDKFFARCEAELSKNVLKEWPKTWDDLPIAWTDEQKRLLRQYDTEMEKKYGPKMKKLWPIDKKQLEQGAWPQFYIGAFPFCYRLPQYTASVFPPPADHTMSHGGAGTAEQSEITRPLMMGQAPGTHWYHAHKHGSTAINVANGMTGAFIIEGQYDDDLNKWYGDGWTRTQPVMVINQLGVSPNLMRSGGGQTDKGPDFSVNGRLKPLVQMRPGEVQMWRILNTSGRAAAFIDSPTDPGNSFAGFEWMQLAQDGVQLNNTNYQSSKNIPLLMASGNRADLLVKAPTKPGAYPLMVRNEVDPSDLTANPPAFRVTLLTVNVSGTPVDPKSNAGQFIASAPSFPPYLADITSTEVTGKKKIMFATIGGQNGPPSPPKHTIDGKQFDGEVGAVVLLNTVEEWTVMNTTTNISHPFHIHINPFQVIEVFEPNAQVPGPKNTQIPKYVFQTKDLVKDPKDSKKYLNCLLDANNPDTWKDCQPPAQTTNLIWWDVFPIPSGIAATDNKGNKVNDPKTGQQLIVPGYFKMRSRFVDYSGYYVIHCHILAHEDRGMMTLVEVAPRRTPYSHH